MQRLTRRHLLRGIGALTSAAVVGSIRPGMAAPQPIVIGHQAELTGVASIFGFWNDRAA
ncbi:MAG: twin-arginine translocation signal domain-containing protein [Candidatus Tectomicrobia bacterium]